MFVVSKLGHNTILLLTFWFHLHFNMLLQVIFGQFNLYIYYIVITYNSF